MIINELNLMFLLSSLKLKADIIIEILVKQNEMLKYSWIKYLIRNIYIDTYSTVVVKTRAYILLFLNNILRHSSN